jgi:hypothetical protein
MGHKISSYLLKNHENKELIQKVKELEISERECKNEIIKYKIIIQNLKYLDCDCNGNYKHNNYKKTNNKKRRRNKH